MKRVIFVLLLVCLASAAWSQPRNCTVYIGWRQFHGVNMHRGNPCETVLNVNNVGNLTLLWSYATGKKVWSSPAVGNGVVYIGSDNGGYALRARTGAKLWSFAAGSDVFPSAAVANGAVYIGSSDSNLYALSARTGKKLWSYATSGPVLSSAAVANGVVYVGSTDGNVYAFGLN
jgi:outer membrane protein assembly factor BamB